VDLLKIDIEGAEREVFAAIEPGDLDCVRHALIEIHPDKGATTEEVASVLRLAGMTVACELQHVPMVVAWRES
jgi:hypothetical protein